MAGKVAVLNDLAGFGRCSLTAAISVLSAMGVQPCPLPTAVLSAQTGFESLFFSGSYRADGDDYRRMEEIRRAV